MGAVFISYKTEERGRAQAVRAALALAAKCEIWWDQDLQAGGAWSAELDDAVRDASCVVVLWSRLSSTSPWVHQEAAVAKALGKLVPALLEDCDVPAPYRALQTVSLVEWDGSEEAVEFRKLAQAVKGHVVRDGRRSSRSRIAGYLAVVGVVAALATVVYLLRPTVRDESGKFTAQQAELLREQAREYIVCLEQQHGATDKCSAPEAELRQLCAPPPAVPPR